MRAALMLPGLERLMEVCRTHGFPLKLHPPGQAASEESLLGHPFDPVLAAVYTRMAGALLGDFVLYRAGNHEHGLVRTNEDLRRGGTEPFNSCIVFGQEPSLAYYYATVPALADSQGFQPVVYIEAYMDVFVLPVASSVDRFFNVFSRYLELQAVEPLYISERHFSISFPWDTPELIAEDELLMEGVSAGRFDFLMRKDEQTREWLSRLQKSSSTP